jgi:hypothetical protein
MAQWLTANNNANSAPEWNFRNTVSGSNPTGNTDIAYGNTLYGNSTVGAWTPLQAVGVFGVNSLQAANSQAVTHAGWNLIKRGTGPVATITVANAGANYNNTNIVRVSNGTTNAVGTIITNATGNVVSVAINTFTNGGSGFVNTTAAVITVANATGGSTGNGQGATFTLTLGGRAGRVQAETLIAMGSLANGGATGPYLANI